MSAVTPQFIKGLFHHLVRAVGGVEAAGAYLGVSHQRVSQLQSIQNQDLPNFMQVAILEAAAGQSVVFAALARATTGKPPAGDLMEEVADVHEAAVEITRAVRAGADAKTIQSNVIRLQREVEDVATAAQAS